MLASFVLSLTDFDPREPDEIRFIGLDNYTRLVNDPIVAESLWVTLRFALIVVPLTLAVRARRGDARQQQAAGRPERLPDALLPADADPDRGQHAGLDRRPARDHGLAEPELGAVGIDGPNWLQSTTWVGPALALMGLWGIGNMMLIFLAGLQGVPTELYDAAKVDGAGPVASFRHVTLPQISPVLFYNLIIALIARLPVLHPGVRHQQRPR